MAKPKKEWVFVVTRGAPNAPPEWPMEHFHCTRCGERVSVSFPINVTTMVEMMKGFSRAHRGCKERKDG